MLLMMTDGRGAPPGSDSACSELGATELSAQAAVRATNATRVLHRIWRASIRTFSERESRGHFDSAHRESRAHTKGAQPVGAAHNSKTAMSLGDFHEVAPPFEAGANRSQCPQTRGR